MRVLLAVALLAGMGTTAGAVECPSGSSSEALTVFNWQFTPASRVMVSVRNSFDTEVRMVDAEIYFIDALGRLVGEGPLPVDPDLAIFPNAANSFQVVAPPGYERLAMASLSDYEVTMCTKAVLFKDGTKATF